MNIEKLRQLKKDAGYTNKMIAEESRIPLGTVQKIFSGETNAPRFKTLKAIENVLIPASGYEAELRIAEAVTGSRIPAGSIVAEKAFDYNAPAETVHTQEDSEKKPDDELDVIISAVEKLSENAGEKDTLIDDNERSKVVSDVSAEAADSNEIDAKSESNSGKSMLSKLMAAEILFAIKSYMQENRITGYLLGTDAVVDLGSGYLLQGDERGTVVSSDGNADKNVINPDVVLVMDRNKIAKDRIVGAPELIVEIMDSDTRSMQIANKPDLYSAAGVKEYWMIDIDAKNIMAYDFEREAFPSMYGFSGRVPVMTLGDDCLVNFAQLYGKIGFMFER